MALLNKTPWHFADENNRSITSYERVQELIGKGFLFEACAVQSLVLESMLLHMILLKSIDKTPSQANQIKTGLSNEPIGGLIRICREHNLFPSQFIQRLDEFRKKRNSLVHHHLPELAKFDYKSFIEESNVLIEILFKQIDPLVKKRLGEIGNHDISKRTRSGARGR